MSTLSTTMRTAPNLGFLETVGSITGIAAQLAATGTNVYGTLTQLELAEEQAELQEELARRKADLEAELFSQQAKIYEIQASGLAERQSIDLALAQMQAEVLKDDLQRLQEQQELMAAIARERALAELEEAQRERAAAAAAAASGGVSAVVASTPTWVWMLPVVGVVGLLIWKL